MTAGVLSSNELQTIEDEHESLLWETIPKLLIPGFPALDKRLLEFGDRVGEFRLVQQFANHQHVLLAVNGQHDSMVIKTRNKRSVAAAKEVESVCQEVNLLTHTLDHPHIIRCVSICASGAPVLRRLLHGAGAVDPTRPPFVQGRRR
ncbi:unnamed protein product [Prorocentrum cordatum]|uniref:Protein kinase domain-containing protein n=1 Tax=Prorocentrum cordatum TaxID=2364126 RepID=A0ABN9S8I8_9DINO|nr:unnamed protein product [Polarella glacialis]